MMNIQVGASANLRRRLAGGGALVAIFIAFGSMAISARDSDELLSPTGPAESAAPSAVASGTRASRCPECGVIESTREIDMVGAHSESKSLGRSALGQRGEMPGNPSSMRGENYEITIRLQDGSTRVITDSQSAKWKNGARIKVIAGMNQ